MNTPLLEATELCVEHLTREGPVRSLDGVNLTMTTGQTIGIAGESGSGKSTLAVSLGRLLPDNAQRVGGDLKVAGSSIFTADADQLRSIRREYLGFIFQAPIATLNPTARIGKQFAWATGAASRADMAAFLARVDLPETVLDCYPHELSGGMAQRVVIATAMARRPRLLVADEPTSALDASIRTNILDLLLELTRSQGSGLLLFSHDLRSLKRYCSWTGVMYGGRVVEFGERERVFASPAHPYTQALLRAAPGMESVGGTVVAIPGAPPVLRGESPGCAFAPRCPLAADVCRSSRPLDRVVRGRQVLCHRAEETR